MMQWNKNMSDFFHSLLLRALKKPLIVIRNMIEKIAIEKEVLEMSGL